MNQKKSFTVYFSGINMDMLNKKIYLIAYLNGVNLISIIIFCGFSKSL